MTQSHDITDLIFPPKPITSEGMKRLELWSKASEEAFKQLDGKSPMKLFKKAEEIYKQYLIENKIEYDDRRGF